MPWSDAVCSHCGYCFADKEGDETFIRRDSLPHRGGLIHLMGTAALYAGTAGLCVGPLGLMLSLALGIPAAWMASHDLERMKTGEIDSAGKADTESGMQKASLGMALGLILGGVFTLWLLSMMIR